MALSSSGWVQPSLPRCHKLAPSAQGWSRAPSEAHQAARELVFPGVVLTGKSVVKEVHLLPRNIFLLSSIPLPERGITATGVYCFTGYRISALLFHGI